MSRSAAIRESLDRRRQEIKRGGTPGDDFGCDAPNRGAHDRSAYNFRERRTLAHVIRPQDDFCENGFAFGPNDLYGSGRYANNNPEPCSGLNPGLTSYLQSRGLATTFLNSDKGTSSLVDRPERSPASSSYLPNTLTSSLGLGLTGSYADRGGASTGGVGGAYRSLLSSSYLTDPGGRTESAFERYRRKSVDRRDEVPQQEERVFDSEDNGTWYNCDEAGTENQNGMEETHVESEQEYGGHDEMLGYGGHDQTLRYGGRDETLKYSDVPRTMRYIGATGYIDKPQQQPQPQQQRQPHGTNNSENGLNNNNPDDVVYYSLFDNYIVVHLETVAADDVRAAGTQSAGLSTQQSRKSSSIAARSNSSLSAGTSFQPDFGSGPWLKEIHVPLHKKPGLIKNLEGLIVELQQKVSRLREDAEDPDVVTSKLRNMSDQCKIQDVPVSDRNGGEMERCGSTTCPHAEELRALKTLQGKQDKDRVSPEEQIIHRTDAEKCASKLESDNRQLTFLLKQAQDRLTQYQKNPNGEVRDQSKEDLFQRIRDTRVMVQSLPQQCEHLKQDCYNLQWWMTEEMNKIRELVQDLQESGVSSTIKTPQSRVEQVKPTPYSSKSKPLSVRSNDKKPPVAATKSPRAGVGKSTEQTKTSSSLPPRSIQTDHDKVRPPLKPKLAPKTKVPFKDNRKDSLTDSEGQEAVMSEFGGESDKEDDIVSTEISAILAAISKLNADAINSSENFPGGDDANSLCSESTQDERNGQNQYINQIYDNEIIPENKNNIDVICRLRPLIKEDGDSPPADLQLDPINDCTVNIMYRNRLKTFEVNHILSALASQEQLLEEAKSTVLACLTGFNVTFFAYGHTGSGKSYTLQGTSQNPGVIRRIVDYLLESLNVDPEEWDCSVTIGVTELYNDVFRDLVDHTNKLEVKQNPDGSIGLPGLTHEKVLITADVDKVLSLAQINRGRGIGKSSEHSARSHLLTIITVSRLHRTDGSKTVINKINFVDLAGSERVDKTLVDAARYKEAQNISKTLTCVGDVIYARRSRGAHVPIRSSRLTHLLQDSLMGSSHILLMVMLSSSERHISETIASLMFAQRVSVCDSSALNPSSSRRGSRQECNVSMESLASRQSNGMKLRAVEIDISGRRSSVDSGTPPSSNSRRTSGKATPEREPSTNRSLDRSRSSRALSEGMILVKPVKPHYAESRPEAYKKAQAEESTTSRTYPKSPIRR